MRTGRDPRPQRVNRAALRTGRRATGREDGGAGATSPAWPALALVALVPAIFDPWGWDRFGPAKWLIGAALVSAWAVSAARRGTVVHDRALTGTWVALLAVASAATLAAPDRLLALLGEGSRQYGLISLLLVFGAYLAGCSTGAGGVTSISRALVAGGGAVAGYGLAQMAGWDPLAWSETLDLSRARSTLGNAAFLGGYLTLVLPLAGLKCTDPSECRRWRIVHGATFVGGLVVLAGTKTRGSWIGLVVGLVVCAWIGRRFLAALRPVVLVGLVVAGVGVGATVGVLTSLGPRALSTLDPASGTAAGRLDTWADTLDLVQQRPVLGWGPEGFRLGFPRVVSREWVERYGQEQVQDRAHNLFLDTVSTLGVAGLAAYCALLVALARTARSALRRGRRDVVGIVAGLTGYLVHAQFVFDTFDLSLVFWALAGVLAAQAGSLTTWRPRRGALTIATVGLAAGAAVWGVVGVVADHRVSASIPGRPDSVVASLARAAALRPRTLEYHLLAGRVAVDSDDEATLRRAHRLLQTWPDRDVRLSDADVLTKLGAVADDVDLLRQGADLYMAIVGDEPFAGLAWLGLGEARLRLGQATAARGALVEAASLLPRSPDPHLALGFLSLSQGQRADAAGHLEAARSIAPGDSRVAELARELDRR